MRSSPIDVAVCIVRADDGRILMAERTPRQISAGFWELPGGKIEPGETALQAALRELAEEVGIVASAADEVTRYEHAFPTRRVRLHVFGVRDWHGTPHGREGQRVAWVDPLDPDVAPILPSVERVLTVLGLPPEYGLSRARDHGGPQRYLDAVHAALERGLRLIHVEEPELPPDQRIILARRIAAIAHAWGARVVLAGTPGEAFRAGVAGIHSTCSELARLSARPPVRLWTVCCDLPADLERAAQLGADAAIVCPKLDAGGKAQWNEYLRLHPRRSIRLYAGRDLLASASDDAAVSGDVGRLVSDWDRLPDRAARSGNQRHW